jgi:hypothetical protein
LAVTQQICASLPHAAPPADAEKEGEEEEGERVELRNIFSSDAGLRDLAEMFGNLSSDVRDLQSS